MKNNEIMDNVQLNEESRKKTLLLVLAASLLAIGAALLSLFRFRKSAKAEAKKARRMDGKKHAKAHEHTERTHKSSAEKTSAPIVQPAQIPVVQQPVYVVRPLPEQKPVSKAKRFSRRMCASVAAILVLSVIASDTMHYIPAVEIEAKESFSGISQIVSDHPDENTPYVILDVVTNQNEHGNSLGTINYLTGGDQIAIDLKDILEGGSVYHDYDARISVAESMLNEVPMDISYEERYDGVDYISGPGWMKLFDSQPEAQTIVSSQAMAPARAVKSLDAADGIVDGDSVSAEVPSLSPDSAVTTGYFFAKGEYSKEPQSGYNFDLVGESSVFTEGKDSTNGEFIASADGQYQLAFGLFEGGNYKVGSVLGLSNEYLSSWVYKMENGVWVWTGQTIADLLANDALFPAGSQQPEVTEPEDKEKDEEPEQEPDEGDSGDNETDEGDSDNTGGTTDPTDSDPVDPEPADPDPVDPEPTDPDTTTEPNAPGGDSVTEGMSLDVSKNIPVLGRWYRLVDAGNEIDGEAVGSAGSGETVGSAGGGNGDDSSAGADTPDTGNTGTDGNRNGNSGSTGGGSTQSSGWDGDRLAYLMDQGYAVVIFEYTDNAEEGQYSCVREDYLENTDSVADTYVVSDELSDAGEHGVNGGIRLLSSGGGRQVDGNFVYVGEGEGHWKLTRISTASTNLEDSMVGYAVIAGVGISFRVSGTDDLLKKYVFSTVSGGDNPNNRFTIEVNTKLANKVTPEDVFAADLILLEDNSGNGASFYSSTDPEQDMSATVVVAILNRATLDLMPVIVDYTVTHEGTYSTSNYASLARAMLKQDLEAVYRAAYEGISKDSDFIDNLNRAIKDPTYPDKTDNTYDYVNRNVYVFSNTNGLVADETDFAGAMPDADAVRGFSEVLTAIKAENLLLPEDNKIEEKVSKAKAIQYIINYSVGMIGEFSDLTILELQPTANRVSDLMLERDSKGYAKLLWKTQSMTTAKQILSSKKDFEIYKDMKAVAEFNGEWADLNGTYDIIFIGLDGQRLNIGGDGKAQYNNGGLTGKVYHSGDDSGVGKYDANDITPQKMTDLIDYMKAGYPIVVEDDFFKKGSAQGAEKDDINTEYIGDDTFMYRFLQVALTDYKDCIFSVSDTMSSAMFITEVRLAKPVVNLIDENGNEAARLQALEKGENGEYHGIITYEIKNKNGDDYQGDTVVNLYADYNFDGMFTVEELVTEYAGGNGMIDVVADGMDAGILPWKLEVADAGNTNRRDSVQGYFVMSTPAAGELNVLQVTEKLADDRVNLQRIFNYKEDSLLAYYLRGAESSINTTMQFETVSTGQLETLLSENAKYLELYDVVVLTMDGSAESGAVTQAVTDYVNAGRSLLVCNQGVETPMARMGLSSELLGQTDSGTFTNLGFSSGLTYFRYAGLTRDMFEATVLLSAEPINEGSISYYPYQLGTNIAFGERASLKASPYLLDFEGNLASEPNATYVTAWYTFSSATEASAYGISPRDARNNYYCYSKGNVVYLAQSEYPYTYDSKDIASASGEGATESMMFVNALMAAYNAGVHNANVHIVAGFAPDSAEIESIAVPFDDIWLEAGDSTAGILDNTVDVYFRFRDSNIAKNKTMLISFLYEDPTGPELDIGGRIVNARPFGSPIWTVEEGRLSLIGDVGEDGLTLTGDNQLKTGQTYRIQAPVVTLKGNENMNKADIYIVVQTSFTKSGRDYSVISSDVVSLNRAQLFLLE